MIRVRRGDQFWLVTQDDHARLAGEFAKEFGNAHYARPDPADKVIAAIAMHDRGWHINDDAPLLSAAKLPMDVFEAPRSIEHPAWNESARLAAEVDPYVGLLVTLHQLHLSAMSVSANPPSSFNVQQLRQQFDLNKIQHAMIERLEGLRATLGLRTDRPLRLGLADGWSEPAEEMLKFNFRLLRIMDLFSLAVCCQSLPDFTQSPLLHRPGGSIAKLHVARPEPGTLHIKPWPFHAKTIRANVPYRAVQAAPFETLADFHAAYIAAPVQSFSCELRAS